ncbi:MAG: hypothetical protein PUC59_09065 [Firmicutes bacterium]|nr:hypothetical protein [Bacillota bacterium]
MDCSFSCCASGSGGCRDCVPELIPSTGYDEETGTSEEDVSDDTEASEDDVSDDTEASEDEAVSTEEPAFGC